MIFLLTIDNDITSSEVIEWLTHMKKPFVRINDFLNLDQKISAELKVKGRKENCNKNHSIWYRKKNRYNEIKNLQLNEFYNNESAKLVSFLFPHKGLRNHLGYPFEINIHKLELLENARQFGLNTPNTLVTNSKKELLKFIKAYGNLITKALSDQLLFENGSETLITYTKLLKRKFIQSLGNTFPTSLFQEYIDKEIEIRIFYLKGKLYPMAIFSQSSKKTEIDFRNYDYENMNRFIPYKLPKTIETNLISFMKECKFEGASIDMLKSKKTGQLYFLEVNPWGQFGMVSGPCNYYLERKLAEVL